MYKIMSALLSLAFIIQLAPSSPLHCGEGALSDGTAGQEPMLIEIELTVEGEYIVESDSNETELEIPGVVRYEHVPTGEVHLAAHAGGWGSSLTPDVVEVAGTGVSEFLFAVMAPELEENSTINVSVEGEYRVNSTIPVGIPVDPQYATLNVTPSDVQGAGDPTPSSSTDDGSEEEGGLFGSGTTASLGIGATFLLLIALFVILGLSIHRTGSGETKAGQDDAGTNGRVGDDMGRKREP
jgi:hypothetical protein